MFIVGGRLDDDLNTFTIFPNKHNRLITNLRIPDRLSQSITDDDACCGKNNILRGGKQNQGAPFSKKEKVVVRAGCRWYQKLLGREYGFGMMEKWYGMEVRSYFGCQRSFNNGSNCWSPALPKVVSEQKSTKVSCMLHRSITHGLVCENEKKKSKTLYSCHAFTKKWI